MADHPLRPATDRRLGGPLPRQQANRTQAALKAPFGFGPRPPCGISPSFPGLSPTSRHIPTRFSPVRRSPRGARDLHVLGVPPAFALSQDQTLRFITPGRAEARPGVNLPNGLRSPLSIRSAPPDRRTRGASLRGKPPDERGRKHRMLSEDRCCFQRSSPSQARRHAPHDAKPKKDHPASLRGEETVPEGRKISDQTGKPVLASGAPVKAPSGADIG